ncbi:hypothetical protein BT63DRAFT_187628 [Microthyrium microscopicum]|uniref:Uncharacterized protein n=1 Tax=Microthyrium microscopicum TaxID=703497 RepID=A0A6A6UKV6_9PEZI|nr:hypothetical protein BT63DRAFT_187628 [Microthyrium microscopicum]
MVSKDATSYFNSVLSGLFHTLKVYFVNAAFLKLGLDGLIPSLFFAFGCYKLQRRCADQVASTVYSLVVPAIKQVERSQATVYTVESKTNISFPDLLVGSWMMRPLLRRPCGSGALPQSRDKRLGNKRGGLALVGFCWLSAPNCKVRDVFHLFPPFQVRGVGFASKDQVPTVFRASNPQ